MPWLCLVLLALVVSSPAGAADPEVWRKDPAWNGPGWYQFTIDYEGDQIFLDKGPYDAKDACEAELPEIMNLAAVFEFYCARLDAEGWVAK